MKKLLQLKYSGLIVCFIFSLIYLSIFYHGALFHSNKYLFYNEGDAIKNYYNYAWHIKNDKSFTQLNGTSYPFGENIFMEDSMPLLSNVLKVFSKIIPGTTQYSIGILNFLLLFSLAIGSVFVYLILAHFRVSSIIGGYFGNCN